MPSPVRTMRCNPTDGAGWNFTAVAAHQLNSPINRYDAITGDPVCPKPCYVGTIRTRGPVSPAEFIPMAERTGLILPSVAG